jgi:hypothetical protein
LPFARSQTGTAPHSFCICQADQYNGQYPDEPVLAALIVLWAATNGQDWVHHVWSADTGAGYVFLSNLIASAVTVLPLLPEFRRIGFSFDTELWVRMIKYAAPLIIVSLAGIVDEMFESLHAEVPASRHG